MKKVLAIFAALLVVLGAVAMAGEVAVMDHAGFVAADVENQVVVETYVQDAQGWWEKDGQGVITAYLQSPDGAYFAYNMACTEEDATKLVPGTKIRVTGFKAEWAGEVEIIDATFEFVEGDTFVAEPFDVSGLASVDELEAHMNEKILVKDAEVVAKKDAQGNDAAFLYNWDGSGEAGTNCDLYFDLSIGGNTYTFVVESYLRGQDTDTYKAVEALKVGDKVDVEGFLYWYEGPQVHSTVVTVK